MKIRISWLTLKLARRLLFLTKSNWDVKRKKDMMQRNLSTSCFVS